MRSLLMLTAAVAAVACLVIPAAAGDYQPIFEDDIVASGMIGDDIHFGLDKGTFDVFSIGPAVDLVNQAPTAPSGGADAVWHQCIPQGSLPATLVSKGYNVVISSSPMP